MHEKEAAKRAYFENLCRHANNSTDAWKLVNKILRKRRPKAETPILLRVDENFVSYTRKMCNALH